jgi:hypothetical protein
MKWFLGAVFFSAISLLAAPKTSNDKSAQPPADPDLFKKDVQVFSGHVEFLYWRVQEAALDYALKMRSDAAGPPYYAQGRFEKATFNGDPGFRVAASFFRAPNFWEGKVQYTRLTARGHDTASKPDPANQFLTGTWPQITTDPLSSASSHIHMNYNVADLWVDRYFIPNPHLRLRFLGGATVAWINQDWKVRYYDATGLFTTVRNRWSFAGGGFRIGTTVDWYWGYDVYVTALATLAPYIGAYHNRAKQKSEFLDPSLLIRNTDFHDCRPSLNVQGYVGPSWQKNFPKNRVELFVGYEINTWFNLQEVYRSTSGDQFEAKETWINNGMIALQGLTTRLTVDF